MIEGQGSWSVEDTIFMAKIWPYMLYIWGKKTTKYSICKKNVEKNKKDEKNILTYRYK